MLLYLLWTPVNIHIADVAIPHKIILIQFGMFTKSNGIRLG